MLKHVFLATSMLIAAPAFAQDKPATPESLPMQTKPAPVTPVMPATDDAAPALAAEQTATATDTQATPAPNAEAAQTNDVAAQPEATENAQAQPAAASSQEQVAMAVGRDFGTYDKDADGALNAAEFGTWMSSLRKAVEPSFAPESPEAKTWAAQAFTSADADKSASVNKQELTRFLTPKPS